MGEPTFRTAVTTDMSFLETLACAATVVGCIVCRKNEHMTLQAGTKLFPYLPGTKS